MIGIVAVPTSKVRDTAMFCLPLIDKAAAKSFETRQSLIDLAANGDAAFWVAHDGAKVLGVCFTQIRRTASRGLILDILALGGIGGMRWLRSGLAEIMADARKRGVERLTFNRIGGRKTFLGRKPKGFYYEEDI